MRIAGPAHILFIAVAIVLRFVDDDVVICAAALNVTMTGLRRSAILGEVWRAGYPLGAPPRNLYFAQVGRLRRPTWAKKKILGGGFTAPKPPPRNSCSLNDANTSYMRVACRTVLQ